jgi:ParB-like chromosome segregation protein Spo0J
MKLSTHPIAELMPNMSTGGYEALKAGIKEHGQEVPILLLNGQILDGRHRYRAWY